jgi:hypothetical protein
LPAGFLVFGFFTIWFRLRGFMMTLRTLYAAVAILVIGWVLSAMISGTRPGAKEIAARQPIGQAAGHLLRCEREWGRGSLELQTSMGKGDQF